MLACSCAPSLVRPTTAMSHQLSNATNLARCSLCSFPGGRQGGDDDDDDDCACGHCAAATKAYMAAPSASIPFATTTIAGMLKADGTLNYHKLSLLKKPTIVCTVDPSFLKDACNTIMATVPKVTAFDAQCVAGLIAHVL